MRTLIIISFFLISILLYPTKGESMDLQENEKFDSIVYLAEDACHINGNKANALVRELYEIAYSNPTDLVLLSKSIYIESLVNITQGNKDTVLICHIISILDSWRNNKNAQYAINILKYALMLNYANTEDYAKSFTLGLEILEEFKNIKDTTFIIKTLNSLGVICTNIKSPNMAVDYFEKALQYTKVHRKEYYNLQLNLFSVWTENKEKQKIAIKVLSDMVPVFLKMQDSVLLLRTYTNLALSYLTIDELDKAFEYYSIILEMVPNIDNKKFVTTLYLNLGAYFYNRTNYKEASLYLHKAKTMAKENKDMELYSYALEGLSYVWPHIGKIDSAYYYLLENNQLGRQLFNNTKTIEAYKEYISVFFEASKNKLSMAEQELALRNKRLLIVVISAVGIIAVILLLLIIMQQKKKQKERENFELTERLEQEKLILQLKEEKNDLEMESKMREITSYSFQLANKNQLLQQIADLSKALPNNQKEANEIKYLIKTNLNSENEWNDFLMQFNKVHPAFFDKLKHICGDFTEINLRVFAYFRIGMSIKQIAQIMNVSPRSVIMHRHRLKKKLGLEDDDNMDDFIRNI